MKRVLVTGARGFLGAPCLPALEARGFQVHAVSRAPSPGDERVVWHQADLLEPGAPARLIEAVKPTHLLHLAWYAEHGAFWWSSWNLAWVSASLALLEAFVAAGGQRVVGAGSCAEYDWSLGGACREDATPLRPATLYGTAKHAVQQLQASYLGRVGVSQAWGRVFFAYGPGEPGAKLVSSLLDALLEGRPARVAAGAVERDLMFVDDVAGALVHLLDGAWTGPVNLGSGQPVALGQVARVLGRLVGREDLVEVGERVEEPGALWADVRRLADDIGWRPAYDLEAGLAETVRRRRARGGVG